MVDAVAEWSHVSKNPIDEDLCQRWFDTGGWVIVRGGQAEIDGFGQLSELHIYRAHAEVAVLQRGDTTISAHCSGWWCTPTARRSAAGRRSRRQAPCRVTAGVREFLTN